MSKRMSFPKKREDIEKITEEVESEHRHEQHHHHHGVEEHTANIQLLIDALSTRITGLEDKIMKQSIDIARVYKVLAYIVEAIAVDDIEAKKKTLREALKILESQ
ncbi:MAG: hypothetical protein QXO93_01585 [Acidilobaceae archaeon]